MEENTEIKKTEFRDTGPETIGRLLVTGDLHGDAAALTMIGKQMEPRDILFAAGDFGFLFLDDEQEHSFLTDVDLFLRKNESYIVFVDGNHENHKALAAFPTEEWQGAKVHRIRSHIIHVMRGEVLTLKGKRIYCFGGAFSIDRSWRVLNESWWEEEIPTDEEFSHGTKTLEKYGYNIDYVLTHTCPLNMLPCLGSYHAAPEERPLQNYFQWVSEQIAPSLKQWFFGHWHQDKAIGEKYRAIYLDVVDMESGEVVW